MEACAAGPEPVLQDPSMAWALEQALGQQSTAGVLQHDSLCPCPLHHAACPQRG